jgi:outer membrane cobalamin receptor
MGKRILTLLVTLFPLTAATASAAAQVPDTSRSPYQLDEVVVVAHRTETALRESAAATTVLRRSTIEQLPVRKLPDVLRYVPGLIFVDRHGSGELSTAIARGFFGGGETEYVLVTVDGVPINDLRTGGVDWTQIPVAAIDRIEVLRGSASTVYGDAAIGAVINVVTGGGAEAPGLTGQAIVGAWEDLAVRARVAHPVGPGRLAVSAAADRGAGYRDQSESHDVTVSARYDARWSATAAYAEANVQELETEDPGPLTATLAEEDPRQHNPLFAADARRRRHLRLGIGLRRDLGEAGRLDGAARLEIVGIDETSTLLLAPSFGDTQRRDEDGLSVWTRLQYTRDVGFAALLAGAELERGTYGSRYVDPADDGDVLTAGAGGRTKLGLYAEARRELADRLHLSAGLRYDAIFVEHERTAGERFDQWSPRVGVNFAYSTDDWRAGNLYAAWTRSFKTPTLDQLYDERETPAGPPGVVVNISNPALLPQRSTGVELGIYQRLPSRSDVFQGEFAASVYRLDLDDEIDFDLSTFRYGNILASRHDGVELSVTASLFSTLALTHSSTWMNVSFRSGEFDGNRLKNIPSTAMTNTARVGIGGAGVASVTHYFAGGVYLDDANLQKLPGGSTFDAAVQWSFGRVRWQLTAINLTDEKINRVGFLLFDPATSTEVRYVYPSGGRYLNTSVSLGF